MALKPCSECGREISTEATSCPHCGKKNPTGVRTSPIAMGCLVLVLLGVLGSLITSKNTDSSSSPVSASTADAPSTLETPASPPARSSQWTYSHDADEMTGKVSHLAALESENTVDFDFPYHGTQHARLWIRRHPRHGNDVIFAIERGQLLCPSYEGCTILVRFDNGEPASFSANPPADHSTESVFITNYDRFVTKMRVAKQVRISPQVYQQGSVVFTFDVSGFDAKKFRGE